MTAGKHVGEEQKCSPFLFPKIPPDPPKKGAPVVFLAAICTPTGHAVSKQTWQRLAHFRVPGYWWVEGEELCLKAGV